jgi:hypothetical protein
MLLSSPYSDETTAQTNDLIDRCQRVDRTLYMWQTSLPDDWKYTEAPYEAPQVANGDPYLLGLFSWPPNGTVHIYRDNWVLFHHSTNRIHRAFLQAIILRCGKRLIGQPRHLSSSGSGTSPQAVEAMLVQARASLRNILDASCRSVHFVSLPGYAIRKRSDLTISQHLGATTAQMGTNVVRDAQQLRAPLGGAISLMRLMWFMNSVTIADVEHMRFIKAISRVLAVHFGYGLADTFSQSNEMTAMPLFEACPDLPPM